MKEQERQRFEADTKFLENRESSIQETRARNAHKIKRSFSYFQAFEDKLKRKQDEKASLRAEGVEERQRLEKEWKAKCEADQQARVERRTQLRILKEADRTLKREQRKQTDSDLDDVKSDNFFTKVFNRGLHESYDRRARQDRVIDYMTAQNFFPQSTKASEGGAFFAVGDQNTNNQQRKEKLIQNHSALAQQIESRRKAKESQRAESREWARVIKQEA